ncbi:Fic family protein [Candidatus Azambacteria bacterium]|nr:Fic family protein [Candidatus Azambacteria bacterium]
MVKALTSIAESKAVIERATILPQQELRLRRATLVRMTHSSTAIEGNRLNINEVGALLSHKRVDAPQREIHEVKNYLAALRYIEKIIAGGRPISEKVLLRIHALVTAHTLPKEQSGRYRKTRVYVVKNRAGFPNEVVYTAPDAKKAPQLCKGLLAWLKGSEKNNINPVVVAGIIHQEVAAIHPFTDGNGRTARAFATLALYRRGYDFRRLFALEDHYNRDRAAYYAAINIGENYEKRRTDFTPWLEYFVEGFKEEIDNVRKRVVSLSHKKINDRVDTKIFLQKEQIEILDLLEQTGRITMKDVAGILKCPKRTAQLHLQKLKKLGLLAQVGKGPASAYVMK